MIAALEEFGKYDYDRASTNAIIENSKTSKGTFYHYFKNKEELYLELIKKVAEEKVKYMQTHVNEAMTLGEDATVFDILKSKIAIAMNFSLAYPEYAALSSRVAMETNHDIKRKVQHILGDKTNDYLSEVVKQNVKQGKIRDDIPEDFLSQMIVYMIAQFSDFIAYSGVTIHTKNMPQIMAYLHHYFDVLEDGMKAK